MFFSRHSSKINDSKIALDSRIEVHDKSQFEVKFDYNFLNTTSKEEKYRRKKYSIEAYFFIPKNVGVSSINYTKSQFYNDLHAYIRFQTPDMNFNEVNDDNNIHSPLRILKTNLEKLKVMNSEELDNISITEAKLFGCLINGFLKEGTKQIKRLINQATYYKNIANSQGFLNLIEKEIKTFINDTLAIYDKYRAIRREYEKLESLINQNIIINLKLVDEYNTYRLENSFAVIHNEIETLTNLKDIDFKNVLDFIKDVASNESKYRIEQNFIFFKNSTSVNYEYFSYRFSAIKKHIFQVLYLDIRHIKNEKKYKNMTAALGAGLAALMYMPAQWMITSKSQTGLSVLFMIIIAYTFKDRLKEFSREFLFDKILNRFHKYFPDNELFIQDYTQDNGKKSIIGKCREYMKFLNKDSVEKDITKLRNLNHIVDIDEEKYEEVIYYRKEVRLSSKRIANSHHRRTNIKDIIRFNINEFLAKLDNPTGKINFYDIEKNIFSSLKAPKVYHLNIIFKYKIGDYNEPSYQRIRVVLDKNGIVRLEEVIPRSKFSLGMGKLIEEKMEEEILSYNFDPENESIIN
ncbi:MAG: hypothetical protein H7263_00645 [Candidatus Sericytochromatia bacterium]|nr:hypothetical protein [Candidatus Sericytochromatia bacterium]